MTTASSSAIISLPIRQEQDVVAVRQRARDLAEALGFDRIEQTRLATAVSEVARNAFMYARGGKADFRLTGDIAPQVLVTTISDSGPGITSLPSILEGQYRSTTGMGIGLSGARRLVDRFSIESSTSGTTVTLMKLLPARSRHFGPVETVALIDQLVTRRPGNPIEEVQQQNRELLVALGDLRARQDELERVNRELEDTNRGVVALYAELDERADHLRRADEMKTKFLSNMTHEFRTPVNSILALSRLLAERLQHDEEEKNELFYIRKSAQQLSDLVDDLLDIAKVEAGKVEVRPMHFEVEALFSALRGMLRPLLVGQSVQLVFDDPTGLAPIYSDETKVSQILRNFISNALKYTERGEVRVSAELRGGDVAFSVADTGIGIPADALPRIFDEFVQIENPLQRRVKGTGLGLPLSRRLAELLGGRVTVESTHGLGSTFTLSVPLVYRAPAEDITHLEILEGRSPVLIVEDSPEDMVVYQRYLASSRFQVIAARSVEEAIRGAQTLRPVAVVLDIRLHGHDAWDLLIRLKRDDATAHLPVIVASTVDDGRKAMGLGANAFALKPVDRTWLLDTLEALTADAQPVRALVIDDEEAFRFIIREILSPPLFEVAEAASAEAGLAIVQRTGADVVLLDLEMSGLSGYDAFEELRAHHSMPVIVITSALPTAHDKTRLVGAAAVISKSMLSRELIRNVVRDAVGTVSAHRSAV